MWKKGFSWGPQSEARAARSLPAHPALSFLCHLSSWSEVAFVVRAEGLSHSKDDARRTSGAHLLVPSSGSKLPVLFHVLVLLFP